MKNGKNYTYQEKIYRKPLFYICVIVSMIAMFLAYKSCDSVVNKSFTTQTDTLTTKNTQHGTEINKRTTTVTGIEERLRIDTVYIKKGTDKYKAKYDSLLKISPDTCNQYLIELYNACNLLDSAKSVHIERQDSVIDEYKQINGLYKLITHNDTTRMNQLSDSCKTEFKRGLKKGRKQGAITTGIIETLLVLFGQSFKP